MICKKVPILLSGLPGKMASEIARFAPQIEKMSLLPTALSGSHSGRFEFDGWVFTLVPIQAQEFFLGSDSLPAGTVAIDFSSPTAALSNARLYADHSIPFVMGTTGFDRSALDSIIKGSNISAVVAPNTAKPIVALLTALKYISETFPGVLSGFDLSIIESHQNAKVDVSGTAKSLLPIFEKLGLVASLGQIRSIRDPAEQLALGVPASALAGHAYHTHQIGSASLGVDLSISHHVRGRRIYAEGAVAAAIFLSGKINDGSKGEVFSMLDVMRG